MPAAILVVEDDPTLGSIACRILEEAGYRCTWVSSGTEALERFKGGGFAVDAVVMDIRLSDLSGLEVARQIRDLRPRIPILFVSGSAEEPGDDPPAIPWTHLLKPFTRHQLVEALGELLDHQRR